MSESTYEYRLLIERPGVHKPHCYHRTSVRHLAELQLRMDEKGYRLREPSTRVWMEMRFVGPWIACEVGVR